ncbi:MAG: acyl-CoA dehydrogenase family protein [Burkholderiaceae bacterium]|nr:acyl-CoA dehydrogenase family protein [Burkholderiaceae bacterium]
MDLLATSEQEEIRDAVQVFLSEQLPLGRFAGKAGSYTSDHGLWPRFAELGWFGLGISQDAGGLGMGLAEEVLVHREYGRHLATTSLIATTLAAHALAAQGLHDRVKPLLSGELRCCVALALGHAAGDAQPGEINVLLMDPRPGDLVLVWSRDGLAVMDAHTVREPRSVRSFDDALPVARAGLAGRPLACVARESELGRRSVVLAAAYCAGLLEATRDMAVAYAGAREQFGQPIGAFQAVKHKCADMGVRCEVAWAQTLFAALSVQAQAPDAQFQVNAASVVASGAAITSAEDNIQVHGAMGYTAEIPAHLLLKRAHVMNQILGAERAQQAAMLQAASH